MTLRTPTSASATLSGDLSLAVPAGTVSGDLVIVFAAGCSSAACTISTALSGFTDTGALVSGNFVMRAYVKVADGTEGSTFTISNTCNVIQGICLVYTSVGSWDPVVLPTGHIQSGSTNVISVPAITLASPGDALVWFGASMRNASVGAFTPTGPTGFTSQLDATRAVSATESVHIIAFDNQTAQVIGSVGGLTGGVSGGSSPVCGWAIGVDNVNAGITVSEPTALSASSALAGTVNVSATAPAATVLSVSGSVYSDIYADTYIDNEVVIGPTGVPAIATATALPGSLVVRMIGLAAGVTTTAAPGHISTGPAGFAGTVVALALPGVVAITNSSKVVPGTTAPTAVAVPGGSEVSASGNIAGTVSDIPVTAPNGNVVAIVSIGDTVTGALAVVHTAGIGGIAGPEIITRVSGGTADVAVAALAGVLTDDAVMDGPAARTAAAAVPGTFAQDILGQVGECTVTARLGAVIIPAATGVAARVSAAALAGTVTAVQVYSVTVRGPIPFSTVARAPAGITGSAHNSPVILGQAAGVSCTALSGIVGAGRATGGVTAHETTHAYAGAVSAPKVIAGAKVPVATVARAGILHTAWSLPGAPAMVATAALAGQLHTTATVHGVLAAGHTAALTGTVSRSRVVAALAARNAVTGLTGRVSAGTRLAGATAQAGQSALAGKTSAGTRVPGVLAREHSTAPTGPGTSGIGGPSARELSRALAGRAGISAVIHGVTAQDTTQAIAGMASAVTPCYVRHPAPPRVAAHAVAGFVGTGGCSVAPVARTIMTAPRGYVHRTIPRQLDISVAVP